MFVLHPGQELVSVDRAREVVVDAEFEPAKHFRAIVRIGNEQNRQIARALVRAGLAAQPQAVERARTEADDHEVDERFARYRRRLAWLLGEDHVMIRAQRASDALARISLFVHKQQSPAFRRLQGQSFGGRRSRFRAMRGAAAQLIDRKLEPSERANAGDQRDLVDGFG